MNGMSFIRVMTKAQLLKQYQIPACLEEEFLEGAPVFRYINGIPHYLEHQVDDFIRTRWPCVHTRGRVGRRVETEDAAVYTLSQRRSNRPWKQIAVDCKKLFPDCSGSHNPDSVKQIVKRHLKRLRERQ